MWMMVLFDLPVVDAKDRKNASKFRKFLLDNGFEMSQFSVYLRFCGSRDKMKSYVKKLDENAPLKGKITLLFFTDKQFGSVINIRNTKKERTPLAPEQLEIIWEDL
jgi:CRISPR-associated protein Cas2